MEELNRLRGATFSRIGQILDKMTAAKQDIIFSDYGITPTGSNKADRVADFLKTLRGENPNSFMQAFSELSHPNYFPFTSEQVQKELCEAFARDGLLIRWDDGIYALSTLEARLDSAVGHSGHDKVRRDHATPGTIVLPHKGGEANPPQPGATITYDSVPSPAQDTNAVFVIYGRAALTTAFFDFLRAAGLRPLEWEQIVSAMGSGSPFTLDVIKHGLSMAKAIVVLVTPDEIATLHNELIRDADGPHDRSRSQPRPNVLIELGMAIALDQKRTVVVATGNARLGSDLHGINLIQFDGSPPKRNDVLQRLKAIGCAIDVSGNHWMTAGTFLL